MQKIGMNDFSGYTTPAEEAIFCGRETELHGLVSRCKQGLASAITGLPKIGKTSLARAAMRQLKKDDYVCIEINFENTRSCADFYKKAIRAVIAALEPKNWLKKQIYKIKFHDSRNKLRTSGDDEMLNYFRDFLDEYFPCNKSGPGSKLVFLFDEFDSIRKNGKFKDPDLCIAELRDFSQNRRFSFILTGRRTLRMLENSTESSTLAQSIHIFDLRMLDRKNVKEICSRSKQEITPENEALIWKHTQGHPYLLSYMLYHYNQKIYFHPEEFTPFFITYYDSLKKMFVELALYEKFRYLVLFGIFKVSQVEYQELIKYGLIIKDGTNVRAFSEDYDDFLQSENLSVPLWDILGRTEKRFRNFISNTLSEEYGKDWFSQVPDACIKAEDRKEMEDRFERLVRKYDTNHQLTVLDCSYLPHLSQLLSYYWERVFRKILGNDKKRYTRNLEQLKDPRNKEAHGLDFLLSVQEKNDFIKICQDLNDLLDEAQIDMYGTYSAR